MTSTGWETEMATEEKPVDVSQTVELKVESKEAADNPEAPLVKSDAEEKMEEEVKVKAPENKEEKIKKR